MLASNALQWGGRSWRGFRARGGRLARAARHDVLLVGSILLVLWAAIATWCVVGYRTTAATAERTAGSIAGAAEQGMSRTIEAVDQRLRFLRQSFKRDPAGFSLSFLGADGGYRDGMILQVAFIDAAGMLRQSSLGPTDGTLSLADRPHFRVHLEREDDLLYISVPVLGRLSKRWSVQFTRKVFGPDGAFAGVLVGSLDPYWMTQLQELLDVNGSLLLLGDDGVVRASAPDLSQIGRALPDTALGRAVRAADHGSLVLPLEGRGTQLVNFRHLRNYPLSVVVALDEASIFADYRRMQLAMLVLGLGLTALVLGVGVFLVHYRLRVVATQGALTDAIENIDQGLVMLDGHGRLSVHNRRFAALLHLPAGAARRGTDLRDLLGAPGGPAAEPRPVLPGSVVVEERFQPDGSVLEVRTKGLPDGGQVRTYTDVTERWEAEERIFFLAHHDALTGLANRVTLAERLGQALAAAGRDGSTLAVMCLDLDRFKHVNDSMGHAVGDELLKQVADRLRDVTRASDIVTRTGGDEFIVVQTQLSDGFDAVNGAERIRNAMRVPFLLDGREMVVGTSIGIALFPGETDSIEGLLKNADAALYRAKDDGRGGIRFFEPSMEAEARERAELEQDLRVALAEDAFELHYQPLFASDGETVVAYEALLRWNHPLRGLVSPARFIPIAEECGLILPLGRWVLNQACLAAAGWAAPRVVAVNLSPVQMRRGDVPDLVAAALAASGLDPRRLELEITEGVLIEDSEGALGTLNALKALGVILALDDFGTGYSSLSYLSRFPFDKIKIDKSFTRGLGTDEGARVIVDTIIAMGKSLRLKVTAEGVETEEQLRFLRRRGCDQFQGFLLGRPMPGPSVEGAAVPLAAE